MSQRNPRLARAWSRTRARIPATPPVPPAVAVGIPVLAVADLLASRVGWPVALTLMSVVAAGPVALQVRAWHRGRRYETYVEMVLTLKSAAGPGVALSDLREIAAAWRTVRLPRRRRLLLIAAGIAPAQARSKQTARLSVADLKVLAALHCGSHTDPIR